MPRCLINYQLFFITFNVLSYCQVCSSVYRVDDHFGLGRTFDGIGAISGGGATSKLLVNYREPYRSQILDYLFKPNFGASLQILKVEIGGDSQSTDGAEASHMHSAHDENYNRGYEWWLMTEAKKRNPDIRLYGLPWVWPGWLGGSDFDPFSNITNTVTYVTDWIQGAKKVHNLTVDYIGIWNEKNYSAEYIKRKLSSTPLANPFSKNEPQTLRTTLDRLNLTHVKIVAADGEWDIIDDLLKDPDLLDVVDVIGVHYTSSHTPDAALVLERPVWASEEYSARNDLPGGGCWARILNEGYVNGLYTASIAWNLIASYYDGLPYTRSSLMTANQPWSGFYDVSSPIWMSAHFTQFSSIGWRYLLHGLGVGNLTSNGSYTALTDGKDLNIHIVTMDPKSVPCFYPMPTYSIAKQNASFLLSGSFAGIKELNVWYSRLNLSHPNSSIIFRKQPPIKVTNGFFSLTLDINEVYTLTTLTTGMKGSHGNPPPAADFPVPYSEDFENYTDSAEPYNFAQQAGVFEVHTLRTAKQTNRVLTQVVPEPPIDTCKPKRMPSPVTLIGNSKWVDVDVAVDFMLPSNGSSGVFLAARVVTGGCDTMYSDGIFLWVLPQKKAYSLVLTGNFSRTVILGSYATTVNKGAWYKLGLTVKGNQVSASFGGKPVLNIPVQSTPSDYGFVALGTETFSTAYFDNFKINSAKKVDPELDEDENVDINVVRRRRK